MSQQFHHIPALLKPDEITALEKLISEANFVDGKATASMAAKDVKNNLLLPGDITQENFHQYLSTKAFPDPELMIRTSGEYRISNFLLYQLAYAELYFTNTLWPDFRKENLYEAILDFQNRERRFGKTGEQISNGEILNS